MMMTGVRAQVNQRRELESVYTYIHVLPSSPLLSENRFLILIPGQFHHSKQPPSHNHKTESTVKGGWVASQPCVCRSCGPQRGRVRYTASNTRVGSRVPAPAHSRPTAASQCHTYMVHARQSQTCTRGSGSLPVGSAQQNPSAPPSGGYNVCLTQVSTAENVSRQLR